MLLIIQLLTSFFWSSRLRPLTSIGHPLIRAPVPIRPRFLTSLHPNFSIQAWHHENRPIAGYASHRQTPLQFVLLSSEWCVLFRDMPQVMLSRLKWPDCFTSFTIDWNMSEWSNFRISVHCEARHSRNSGSDFFGDGQKYDGDARAHSRLVWTWTLWPCSRFEGWPPWSYT